MKNKSFRAWILLVSAIIFSSIPGLAGAQMSFDSIVVFGTSLSDPGNAFTLLAHPVPGLDLEDGVIHNTPPYDMLDESLIPSAPYAKGGHHFSNGATWVEQFAQGRGLAAYVAPAFQSNNKKARNYAVGGARAANYPDRVNLPQQVQTFLDDVQYEAPTNALYVIEMGNNDIRDALVQFSTVFYLTGDITLATQSANVVIADALHAISANIECLYTHGARKFFVWNAARLDLLPAVTALGLDAQAAAYSLTSRFNDAMAQILLDLSALPDCQIAQMDIASQMATMISAPSDFGLTNVTTPCITPDSPPFTCKHPDSFFFWDGIHPTKSAHAIFNQMTADILASYPNP